MCEWLNASSWQHIRKITKPTRKKGEWSWIMLEGRNYTGRQLEYTGESLYGMSVFVCLTTRCYQRRPNCVERVVEWVWIINSLLQHHEMKTCDTEKVCAGGNCDSFSGGSQFEFWPGHQISWSRIMIFLTISREILRSVESYDGQWIMNWKGSGRSCSLIRDTVMAGRNEKGLSG